MGPDGLVWYVARTGARRCQVVITADGVWRGTKVVELKRTVEEALHLCEAQKAPHEAHRVAHVIVVRNLLVDPAAAAADTRPEKPGARPVRYAPAPAPACRPRFSPAPPPHSATRSCYLRHHLPQIA